MEVAIVSFECIQMIFYICVCIVNIICIMHIFQFQVHLSLLNDILPQTNIFPQ